MKAVDDRSEPILDVSYVLNFLFSFYDVISLFSFVFLDLFTAGCGVVLFWLWFFFFFFAFWVNLWLLEKGLVRLGSRGWMALLLVAQNNNMYSKHNTQCPYKTKKCTWLL
jgi:hypothetical protein